MAIRNVVTRGYGPGAAIKWILSRGFLSVIIAFISGTAKGRFTEQAVIAGGKTIILTLSGDTWVAVGATFNAQRANIINGLDSAQSEATGWNAEVRDKEVVTAVVRTSDTVVTITLSVAAAYDITSSETITVTIPATALTAAAEIVAASNIFVTIGAQLSSFGVRGARIGL